MVGSQGTWILSRRWAPEILLALGGGLHRFNKLLELRREDGLQISDRILTERLRDLELAGLVCREVTVGPPTKVRYALTDAGTRYLQPLKALQEVAIPS